MKAFIALPDGEKLLLYRDEENTIYRAEVINLDGRLVRRWEADGSDEPLEVFLKDYDLK